MLVTIYCINILIPGVDYLIIKNLFNLYPSTDFVIISNTN